LRRTRRDWGHAQAEDVSPDVVEQIERRDDERDGSPPPEKERGARHAPKVLVNARLAQVAFDGLGKPHDERADVLIKRDVLRFGLDTATLTNHGDLRPD
jgi:hypothetical protein